MKKKLLVSLVAVLVLLGGMEIAARVAGYAPDTSSIQWERHPELLWRPVPGQDTFFGKDDPATGEERLPIRINDHGQRGPDYPLEKADGEIRVVCVGDSLTFGPGVRDEETYVQQLQAIYDASASGVRVINAAANGYASYQYLVHARTELARLDPDVYVVALFFGNDMELVQGDQMPFPLWLDRLSRRSAIANFLREKRRESWVERRAERMATTAEEVEAELLRYAGVLARDLSVEAHRELWANSIEHIEGIRAVTDELGAELLVLLVPSHVVTRNMRGTSGYQTWEWLRGQLQSRGIATIDPTSEMAGIGDQELWLPFNRGHYTPEGHAAVARALRRGLAEHGFVSSE